MFFKNQGWFQKLRFASATVIALTLASTFVAPDAHAFGRKPTARQHFEDYVFGKALGRNTDAVVVLHQGKLVYERYARGYHADMKHLAWSMTKTIAGALIGIAESEGRLHRSDPLSKYYPDAPSHIGEIRIQDLLHMSSGLKWKEGYQLSPIKSDVVKMLYTEGFRDMGAYVRARPREYAPGERFSYSSGDTNLLMDVLRRTMPAHEYAEYPWKKLFEPLGIRDAAFETDSAGTFVGSSYLYATPRDLAKLGQLYLQQGVWNGRQLIPAEFIRFQRTLSPGFMHPERLDAERPYGAQLWLNQSVPELGVRAPYPSAPEDMFQMVGHEGQTIFVIPSLDVVAVRVARDTGSIFMNRDEYLRRLLSMLGMRSDLPRVAEIPATDRTSRDATSISIPFAASSDLRKLIPKILSALSAKEYCSCRFVVGQSHEICRENVTQVIPVRGFELNVAQGSVRFGRKSPSVAKQVDEVFGCRLIE